jgi:SRSO17 transposase
MAEGLAMEEQETTVVAATMAAVATVGTQLRRHFRRGAAHGHACAYLRGLLSDAERKNGWQLAEHAGYQQPRAIQRVLDRSVWDAAAVRDDLRTFVRDTLGAPDGVLVVDETGFLKQGTKSVGVKRQYSGTAGRIENCQIGVFLGYASTTGRVGIDRALYLPQEWAADPARRTAAGVPADVMFQTKPQLALAMLERALEAGVPAAWVTADEVYGNDYAFRSALEARGQAYVAAVKRTQTVSTWPPYGAPGQARVCDLIADLPAEGWQRLSCGEGAQGERVYDWACRLLRPALQEGWVHALLARRHPTRPEEVAFYLVYAPEGTSLEPMVRAAGSRWAIEDTFKLAKGQVGLDHYEVRSWDGWHRHMTLALWALAILATEVARAKGGTLHHPAHLISSPSVCPNCAA